MCANQGFLICILIFVCVTDLHKNQLQPVATDHATACNWLPLVRLWSEQNPKVPQPVAVWLPQEKAKRPDQTRLLNSNASVHSVNVLCRVHMWLQQYFQYHVLHLIAGHSCHAHVQLLPHHQNLNEELVKDMGMGMGQHLSTHVPLHVGHRYTHVLSGEGGLRLGMGMGVRGVVVVATGGGWPL